MKDLIQAYKKANNTMMLAIIDKKGNVCELMTLNAIARHNLMNAMDIELGTDISFKDLIDLAVAQLVEEVEVTVVVEEKETPTQQTEFKGKKYYTCRRCSGKGIYCDYGICFGCNGYGKNKTKAYKVYLGEPIDDLPY